MQEVLRVGESRLGMALAWALSFSVSPKELSSFEGGAENLLYLLPSLSLPSLATHLVPSSLTFCVWRQQVVPGVWQNAGGWGAFPNVQGLKCCYHVSVEFQIKIWAWCRESHCIMVLYNNFKWDLCFLVLFITNTWIYLHSLCQGDSTVGFWSFAWSLLVHFFPKKLIGLVAVQPSWEGLGGWRFKNFKFVQCPLQQWDHSELWGC